MLELLINPETKNRGCHAKLGKNFKIYGQKISLHETKSIFYSRHLDCTCGSEWLKLDNATAILKTSTLIKGSF